MEVTVSFPTFRATVTPIPSSSYSFPHQPTERAQRAALPTTGALSPPTARGFYLGRWPSLACLLQVNLLTAAL